MILFARKPDAVFTVILDEALADALAHLQTIVSTQEDMEFHFPEASRCFTPAIAKDTIKQLLSISKEPIPYRITDYHYLLLYDCLKNYCEIVNVLPELEPGSFSEIGPLKLREIDFEKLISVFFWDTDFLASRRVMEGLGKGWRDEMGMNDEAFAIAQGWAPHSEDLRVEPADESGWDDDEELFRPGSIRYPDPHQA
jgi:hypothetical protein